MHGAERGFPSETEEDNFSSSVRFIVYLSPKRFK